MPLRVPRTMATVEGEGVHCPHRILTSEEPQSLVVFSEYSTFYLVGQLRRPLGLDREIGGNISALCIQNFKIYCSLDSNQHPSDLKLRRKSKIQKRFEPAIF